MAPLPFQMPGFYHCWSGWSIPKFDLSAVPKLCPKSASNIKDGIALKYPCFFTKSIIFFALPFSGAPYFKKGATVFPKVFFFRGATFSRKDMSYILRVMKRRRSNEAAITE
jgi:hypothetical protein